MSVLLKFHVLKVNCMIKRVTLLDNFLFGSLAAFQFFSYICGDFVLMPVGKSGFATFSQENIKSCLRELSLQQLIIT